MRIYNFLKTLYFYKFRFFLKALKKIEAPYFIGSTLRGGFGFVFKKLSCITKEDECKNCFLAEACPYSNVFTTPVSIRKGTFLSVNSYAPHPFIIKLNSATNLLEKRSTIYNKGEYWPAILL